MQLITTLPLRALKAAIHAAATKERRWYLNGVLVEHCNGMLYVVATDGAMMFMCRLPGWEAELKGNWSLILPLAELKLAIKAAGKADALSLHGTPEKGQPIQIGSVNAKAIDGLFPDWRRICPDFNEQATDTQYDTALLERATNAIGEFDEVSVAKRGTSVYMHRLSAKAAITGKCGNAFCVVMGFRDVGDLGSVKWFKPEYPKAKPEPLAA